MKRSLNWVAKASVASPKAVRDFEVTSAKYSGGVGVESTLEGGVQGFRVGGLGRVGRFFFMARYEMKRDGEPNERLGRFREASIPTFVANRSSRTISVWASVVQ